MGLIQLPCGLKPAGGGEHVERKISNLDNPSNLDQVGLLQRKREMRKTKNKRYQATARKNQVKVYARLDISNLQPDGEFDVSMTTLVFSAAIYR